VYHKIFVKEHTNFILTSRDYAWEEKFIEIAKEMGKVEVKEGEEYFHMPYQKRKYNYQKNLRSQILGEDQEPHCS